MFNSIRWTLQLWHAGILFLALLSFGAVLYFSAERTAYTEIDNELAAAARVFTAAGLNSATPPADRPSPVQLAMAAPSAEAGGSGVVSDVAPPMIDLPSHSALRASHVVPVWLKNVPQDCLRQLGWKDEDHPYFVVLGSDGSVLRESSQSPDVANEPYVSLADLSSRPGSVSNRFRDRGDLREIIASGPDNSTILIGRSIQHEQASLANLRLSLFAGGSMILLIGLFGGFALTQRTLRPIRLMSDAARSISASDLSSRIDQRQIKSELGSLAQTLNRTFDRLESAFHRQAQFTADASHELRTPLAVIRAGSELALTRERSNEEYRTTLESNLRASKRMHALVESLLVLARADAEALVLDYSRFDLRLAADDCVDLVLPVAAKRNISVEADGETIPVEADRSRVLQLITNLLGNAIQYNRDGGSVKIAVARDKEWAVLSVMDTGIGIPAHDQPHVFERFFRVDKARSRESGGCGLGLAICQSVVQAHRGSISFVSTQGTGTTFTVRLPLSKPVSNEAGDRINNGVPNPEELS
jgi:two-component system OmpR family sensor kinase